jgi:GNAT superfamily N-acetyltransferase
MELTIRLATSSEYDKMMDQLIESCPDEPWLVAVKEKDLIEVNQKRMQPFVVFQDEKLIGRFHLVIDNNNHLITTNGKLYIEALELDLAYRGQGLATQVINYIERYANEHGYHILTIGVEPKEVRNMQIYFHWGFTSFLGLVDEPFIDGTGSMLVLYYGKRLNNKGKINND